MNTRKVLLIVLLVFGFASNVLADESRFTVTEPISGEYMVTDAITGLIWQKSYETYKNWEQALSYCENLDYAGETDWRLPNKKELMSLINYEVYSPASDFPDMPSDSFWSSSTTTFDISFAWGVYLGRGDMCGYFKTYGYYDVRCVSSEP